MMYAACPSSGHAYAVYIPVTCKTFGSSASEFESESAHSLRHLFATGLRASFFYFLIGSLYYINNFGTVNANEWQWFGSGTGTIRPTYNRCSSCNLYELKQSRLHCAESL